MKKRTNRETWNLFNRSIELGCIRAFAYLCDELNVQSDKDKESIFNILLESLDANAYRHTMLEKICTYIFTNSNDICEEKSQEYFEKINTVFQVLYDISDGEIQLKDRQQEKNSLLFKVINYFQKSVKNGEDNFLFLIFLVLILCTDVEEGRESNTIIYMESCVPGIREDLEDMHNQMKMKKDEGTILVWREIYNCLSTIVLNVDDFQERHVVDADAYKFRICIRKVCNSCFYDWMKQKVTDGLDVSINSKNYEALLKYFSGDERVIYNAYTILENHLIKKEHIFCEQKKYEKAKTTKMKKIMEQNYIEFAEVCGYSTNQIRVSSVIRHFENLQKTYFGKILIDIKSETYDQKRTSVAYNCNLVMIMKFCELVKDTNLINFVVFKRECALLAGIYERRLQNQYNNTRNQEVCSINTLFGEKVYKYTLEEIEKNLEVYEHEYFLKKYWQLEKEKLQLVEKKNMLDIFLENSQD